MNKNEYLNDLKEKLINLDCKDVDSIIEKYSNRFELGYKANMSDEEIIDSLGDVEEIAALEVNSNIVNDKENDLKEKIVDIDLELEYFEKFEISENEDDNAINLEIDREALDYVDFNKSEKVVTLKTKKEKKNILMNGFVNSTMNGKYHGHLLIGKNVKLNNVNIASANCRLDIDVSLNIENTFNISTTAGDINFETINAKKVQLNSTSGKIDGKTISAFDDNLNISTTSGNVDIETLKCKESITLNLTSADIQLKEVECNKFICNSTSGDVKIEAIKTNNNITINTVSGDIVIRYSDCNNYSINTVSGDITIQSSENEDPVVSCVSVSGEISFCGKVKESITDSIKNVFSGFKNKKNKY